MIKSNLHLVYKFTQSTTYVMSRRSNKKRVFCLQELLVTSQRNKVENVGQHLYLINYTAHSVLGDKASGAHITLYTLARVRPAL